MRRIIGAAALALGIGGTLTACAENTPEIYVVANQVFTDTCEVPSVGGTTFRTRGTLDLFIGSSYLAIPRVENTLVESESAGFNTSAGGSRDGLSGTDWEANHINLQRAVVKFDAPDALGVPVPRQLEVEISGAISPGEAATVAIQAITPSIGQTLANSVLLRENRTSLTINLRIKFYGQTVTGRDVDSNEFVYPVELCYGCLVDIPPEAIDPTYPIQPNCRAATSPAAENRACVEGQDEAVDCRYICPQRTATLNGDPQGICEPTF